MKDDYRNEIMKKSVGIDYALLKRDLLPLTTKG